MTSYYVPPNILEMRRGVHYYILFWTSSKVVDFCRMVQEKVKGFKLEMTLLALLFHLLPMSQKGYRRSLIPHMPNSARACIPSLWKSKVTPNREKWYTRVDEIQWLEGMELVEGDWGTIGQVVRSRMMKKEEEGGEKSRNEGRGEE